MLLSLKLSIGAVLCADYFEQVPRGSLFMSERCETNSSLNQEEIASSAFILDYLLHHIPV